MRETMASSTKGSRISIVKEVKKIIADSMSANLKPEEITEDMHLEKDLGLDSLDRYEVAMTIWCKWELEEIETEDLRTIMTVKEVIDIVKKSLLSI